MKLWFRKTEPEKTKTSRIVVANEPVKVEKPSKQVERAEVPNEDTAAAAPPHASEPVPTPQSDVPSRSVFKQLIDGLYDAALITDVKGYIVNSNIRMTNTIGYSADDVWDWTISQIVPGITDALITQIRQGLARERYVMIEARCTRKDQSTFPAEIAISQLEITKDGNLLFCIRNIERRQLAQQHLKTARRLLDHIPAAALACDLSGNIKIANKAMARMLGYEKPDVMVGQPFSIVWRETRAAESLQRVLAGESVKEPATVVNTRNKQLQLVITLTPDLDAHKKQVGFMVVFTSASIVSLNATSIIHVP